MLKIKWADRITNEKVLDKIKEMKPMWKNLSERGIQMKKHPLRHWDFLGIF